MATAALMLIAGAAIVGAIYLAQQFHHHHAVALGLKCSLDDNQHGECQEAAEGQRVKDTAVEVNNYEMLATGNSCRSLTIVVIIFARRTMSSTAATASNMANTEKRTVRRNKRL
jgi:hypothetical protein